MNTPKQARDWVAKERHPNYGGWVILQRTPHGLQRVDGKDGTFSKEDAQLIAAAPDLLAALKACAERMAELQKHTNYPLAWPRVQAEAAISKAEGRA